MMTALTAKAPAAKPAPVKKAPAKAPAKKAPAKKVAPTQGPKLKWKATAEKDANGNAPAKAETAGGVYEITAGDNATATWTPTGGKPEVLAENKSGKTCWSACVKHHKGVTA